MKLFYSLRASRNPGQGCECEWKSRFQTEGEIKLRTKYEDEGRKKSGVGENLKKKGTVPVSIEREAFAETMIDVSDRREPCSHSLKRPS